MWIGSDQKNYDCRVENTIFKFSEIPALKSSVYVAWEILLLCFDRLCFALKRMETILILQERVILSSQPDSLNINEIFTVTQNVSFLCVYKSNE